MCKVSRQASSGVRAHLGFTLLELLIALVILGVLLAVAFPSYQSNIRKGRRADAFTALAAVQQAQERHRANNASYAGNLNSTPDSATLPNISPTSSNGHYSLVLSAASATGYTATATAAGGQALDTACKVLAVRADGGKLWYGSGSSSVDWTTPSAADVGKCWVK